MFISRFYQANLAEWLNAFVVLSQSFEAVQPCGKKSSFSYGKVNQTEMR